MSHLLEDTRELTVFKEKLKNQVSETAETRAALGVWVAIQKDSFLSCTDKMKTRVLSDPATISSRLSVPGESIWLTATGRSPTPWSVQVARLNLSSEPWRSCYNKGILHKDSKELLLQEADMDVGWPKPAMFLP